MNDNLEVEKGNNSSKQHFTKKNARRVGITLTGGWIVKEVIRGWRMMKNLP